MYAVEHHWRTRSNSPSNVAVYRPGLCRVAETALSPADDDGLWWKPGEMSATLLTAADLRR